MDHTGPYILVNLYIAGGTFNSVGGLSNTHSISNGPWSSAWPLDLDISNKLIINTDWDTVGCQGN